MSSRFASSSRRLTNSLCCFSASSSSQSHVRLDLPREVGLQAPQLLGLRGQLMLQPRNFRCSSTGSSFVELGGCGKKTLANRHARPEDARTLWEFAPAATHFDKDAVVGTLVAAHASERESEGDGLLISTSSSSSVLQSSSLSATARLCRRAALGGACALLLLLAAAAAVFGGGRGRPSRASSFRAVPICHVSSLNPASASSP
eukprot:5396752-Pleurochrysis_carterae.AAC.5